MTIRDLLQGAARTLAPNPVARLEAELLLGHVLAAGRSVLYANPDRPVPDAERRAFEQLLRRRANGEPVAYLIGHREFWTLDLNVTTDVLIPRPESELLVTAALERVSAGAPRRIADLGTGSGAIALAIAQERPRWEVHATDRCEAALAVARDNARRHGLERVRFHLGHWAEPLCGAFDLIVSNPPYIAASDPHLTRGDCRFEPRHALSPGALGTEAIAEIIGTAQARLATGGWLMLEHGYDQGAVVHALFRAAGYEEIGLLDDLGGQPRVSLGRRPG